MAIKMEMLKEAEVPVKRQLVKQDGGVERRGSFRTAASVVVLSPSAETS